MNASEYQNSINKRHLWTLCEQEYVDEKFKGVRDDHDQRIKDEDPSLHINDTIMYLRRVQLYFDGVKEAGSVEDKQHFHWLAMQAAGKACMVAQGFVESMIRVWGDMPQPGVPSGEVREWKEMNW